MAITQIPAEFIPVNAISGTIIADNAVTAVHIATNAISGTLIADNAVTAVHIATNAISGTLIADNAITAIHISGNSVTAALLQDNAVGTDQLAGIARGKIIYGDSNGDPQLLTLGSNGQILKSDGTDISWGSESNAITALNNATENELVTIGSTTTELNAESGLTWDTTTLTVNGAAVFNESSADVDFRIESDDNANMFFVDGGNDRVGIGTGSPGSQLHILAGTDQNAELKICTDDGEISRLGLYEDTAGTQHGGFIQYRGESSDKLEIGHINSGTDSVYITITDAGAVGIGDTNPGYKLDVGGTARMQSTLAVTGATTLSNVLQVNHASDSQATSIRSQATDGNAYFAVGNSDMSDFILLFGGHSANPSSTLGWDDSNDLRFATYQNHTGTFGNERMKLLSTGGLTIEKSTTAGVHGVGIPYLTIGGRNSGGSRTEIQIYASALTGGYMGIDAFKSGVAGTVLALNASNGGKVGIGIDDPDCKLEVGGTDAIHVPSGTTAQRPTAANGMMRYNTTNAEMEAYEDGDWVKLHTTTATRYRYARYRVSTGLISHHPRFARVWVTDSSGAKYNANVAVSDNCSDSGTVPSDGDSWTYDLGSGNSAIWVGLGLYSTYEGGDRSATVYLDGSNDNSSWTAIGSVAARSQAQCGELDFTVS